MKPKPLSKEEQKCLNSFLRLSKKWPNRLMFFGWSGTLIIADVKTGQIYATIAKVCADGGDPDLIIADDGTEYIEHLYNDSK